MVLIDCTESCIDCIDREFMVIVQHLCDCIASSGVSFFSYTVLIIEPTDTLQVTAPCYRFSLSRLSDTIFLQELMRRFRLILLLLSTLRIRPSFSENYQLIGDRSCHYHMFRCLALPALICYFISSYYLREILF